jgi:pimeloyl-ACP methyl ester carboxylesterase
LTQVIGLPGMRQLSVESWGAPDGTPIFLLHGTPGSRCGPRPRSSLLYRLGVRLLSFDRPGYGQSTAQPGRTVADAARDVLAIADRLGLPEFGVVGRSGGGPHALACAALLPDRVISAATLVGVAPSDAEDLDWFDGMTRSNVEEYAKVDASPAAIRAELAERAGRLRDDPESLLRFLRPELTGSDLRVVEDVSIRTQLTDTYAEAMRGGGQGWIDDVLALRQPWGFELSAIKPPVLLWHGADDRFSPVQHTRWLAAQIPGSTLRVQNDAAHFTAIKILPDVLAWIKQADCSERLRVERVQQPVLSP